MPISLTSSQAAPTPLRALAQLHQWPSDSRARHPRSLFSFARPPTPSAAARHLPSFPPLLPRTPPLFLHRPFSTRVPIPNHTQERPGSSIPDGSAANEPRGGTTDPDPDRAPKSLASSTRYQWRRVLLVQVVLGQETGSARVITLNRPRQLNGISDRVVRLLLPDCLSGSFLFQ